MSNGKANTFFKAARAAGASIFLAGSGDSRFVRNGHGEMFGANSELAEAAGGDKGLMCSSNMIGNTWPQQGYVRCGRRTHQASLSLGFTNTKPTGRTGIVNPSDVELSTVTLSGTLTDTSASGDTFTLAGGYSAWPTADFYILIGQEVIRVKTRSGATCTLFATGDGNGYTTGFGRGENGTRAVSHTNGEAIRLGGPDGTFWLGPAHTWFPSGTVVTQGALSGTGTGTFTLNAADVEGWPTAAFQVKIDNELMTCTRSGVTLTITARGFNGTTAASHSVGAAVGLTSWVPYACLQIQSRSGVGNIGGMVYAATFENPTGAVVASAQTQLSIYGVGNGGEDAVAATTPALANGSVINPTWSDAAGTLGASVVECQPTLASSRAVLGVCGGTDLTNPSAGPMLKPWQYMGAANTNRGGLVQSIGVSQGGKTLYKHIAGTTRTPGAIDSIVKMFQSMRLFASTLCKATGKIRYVHLMDCMHNDVAETALSFVVVGQSWSIQYSSTAASTYDTVATTIDLADATNFPTSGHAINTTSGERFSWTGKSSNSLTGVIRGDFGTTAAAITAGHTIAIGYQSREADGHAANVLFFHRLLTAAWNLSKIHEANSLYPIAASGALAMVRAETGAPNAAVEFMTLAVRPPCVWPSPSTPAVGADASSTFDLREGRFVAMTAAVKSRLTGLADLIDVVDMNSGVMSADELAAGNYSDVAAASTLSAAITTTGQSTISVTSTSGWQTKGYVWINGECIRYDGITSNVLQNCVRGVGGTTAVTHSNGTAIVWLDTIHQACGGHVETWRRWAEKNLSGSGGSGKQSINLAATVKVGTPVPA